MLNSWFVEFKLVLSHALLSDLRVSLFRNSLHIVVHSHVLTLCLFLILSNFVFFSYAVHVLLDFPFLRIQSFLFCSNNIIPLLHGKVQIITFILDKLTVSSFASHFMIFGKSFSVNSGFLDKICKSFLSISLLKSVTFHIRLHLCLKNALLLSITSN
jgi:hypothetical protein